MPNQLVSTEKLLLSLFRFLVIFLLGEDSVETLGQNLVLSKNHSRNGQLIALIKNLCSNIPSVSLFNLSLLHVLLKFESRFLSLSFFLDFLLLCTFFVHFIIFSLSFFNFVITTHKQTTLIC